MAAKKSKRSTRKNRAKKLGGKKLDATKTLRKFFPPDPV
jgi:hypothetical protein